MIGVPPTIQEQSVIVSKFRGIIDHLMTVERELAKLRVTNLGHMDDLLTGRVRVTSLLNK